MSASEHQVSAIVYCYTLFTQLFLILIYNRLQGFRTHNAGSIEHRTLNTSDENLKAMLTTEPLDIANIVDIPADLSTPFDYLTNSDTDANNADLCSARRRAWYCEDPACPK
jgi:hypothetical protein